jgi:MerR family copper efflux transcriptional regulator
VELGDQPRCDAPFHPLASHEIKWTGSSTLEVKLSEDLLSIGEISRRTGLAPSALRHYDELGLLPAHKVRGQRRYPPSVVDALGVIRVLRDAGFRLNEIKTLIRPRAAKPATRQDLIRRKISELDDQISTAAAAQLALKHALRCRHGGSLECPTLREVAGARLAGRPLAQAHVH